MFNLKSVRLKEINETFENNINYQNEKNLKDYYLSTNINYKENILSAFKFVENKKNKTTIFRYITNLDIRNSSIKEIVHIGKNRWKIENECFHTQKHSTFI